MKVGNQLPILLIDFPGGFGTADCSWESVTNPLDRLLGRWMPDQILLGISYQSS